MALFSRRDIQQQYPPPSYKRGVSYWLQDRVLTLKSLATERDDLLILHATVEGSEYEPYEVEIEILRGKRGEVHFDSTCSCPVGHRCKHSAAALLKALDTPELNLNSDTLHSFRRKESITTTDKTEYSDSQQSHFNIVSVDENGHVTVEIESENNNESVSSKPNPSRPLQNWLSRLDEAGRKSKKSAKTVTPTTHRLLYLLNFKPTVSRNDNVQIEFISTRVLKNGGYGATYPFKGNMEAKFVTPSDYMLITWLRSIRAEQWQNYNNNIMMPRQTPGELFRQLLDSGRCHWSSIKSQPLTLGPTKSCEAYWDVQTGGIQQLSFRTGSTDDLVLPFNPPWYVNPDEALCGPLTCDLDGSIIDILLDAPSVQPTEVEIVREQFQAQLPEAPAPQRIRTVQRRVEPRPCLRLFNETFRRAWAYQWQTPENITVPLARLSFDYDGIVISGFDKDPLQRLSRFDEATGELIEIKRDTRAEQRARRRLKEAGLHTLQGQYTVADYQVPEENRNDLFIRDAAGADDLTATQALLRFNAYEVPKLQHDGWQIDIDTDYLFQVVDLDQLDDWYADIDEGSGLDWFGLELGIVVNNEKVNLLPLLVDLLKSLSDTDELRLLKDLPGDTLLSVRMEDNRVLPLPLERVRHILETLIELLEEEPLDENGQLRLLNLRAAQLLELEAAMGAARLRWLGGQRLLELGRKLQNFQGVQPVDVPEDFQTSLRPYQQAGLNWLQFLREYGLAGVLADDMGLGKTVQTLAHILIEKNTGRLQNPCLVVAPTSLMTNWKLEAQRFAPALKVLVLHGPERKDKFGEIASHDLVLTTYALLPRDKESLMPQPFHLLILDEAQNIKNPKAKATQIVHQIKAEHRLCLTGTPMENHLGELWSLFHFLMPGLLGDTGSFRFLFRNPIERYDDHGRREILARRVAPFMLRRTKEAVIEELPEKNEILRTVELHSSQRDLYETIRLTMHEKVRHQIAERGLARSQIIILDALLKLRQICCDPRLLKMEAAKQVKHSAKLMMLMEMLPDMIAEGRRILLFSQFTSMLTLIEDELKKQKLKYVKLTGRTRDRETPITQFQNCEVPLFLISLKAGGTGLNLTAADTVIHYDPWWNPAVENQATDRAHRIGQDKKVFVYKLITEHTVEEKIQELQKRKQHLADALFDGKNRNAGQLSSEDLEALFEPL